MKARFPDACPPVALTLLGLAFSAPLLADGCRYSRIDPPGSIETEAHGINARGDIVGNFLDHEFVRVKS